MLSRLQGQSADGRNNSMKNSKDSFGNRTRSAPTNCDTAYPQIARVIRKFNSNKSPTWCNNFQFFILTFIYSSTCFGRFPTHHQKLNDCSGSLWFLSSYRGDSRAVFVVGPADRPDHGFTYVCGCRQLLATTNVCKTRGCNYSFWAPDDERCVARNMLNN